MSIFEKIKDTANQAKDAASEFAEKKGITEKVSGVTDSLKKSFDETAGVLKAHNEESKELKKPLEGALIRYEFTYIGGLDNIPKAKAGAWGMNIMADRFAFRVTMTTKDWLYDMDILYDAITDIRIEKRTISTAEMMLGAGNDANQQQENVIVIEYKDDAGKNTTLRIEMLTGVTIYNQAAKCKEMIDLLRKEDILSKIQQQKSDSHCGSNVVEQIKQLADLKDSGILSEDEFNSKKAELLSKI